MGRRYSDDGDVGGHADLPHCLGSDGGRSERCGTKKIEEALRESEDRLTGIIQSATDAIVTADEQQSVVLFNAAAEKMFGCAAKEAVGAPLDRFVPQRFRAQHSAHIRIFGETGVSNRTMGALAPLRGLRVNGEEFPIEASISQIDSGGKKLFTVILRDVTERVKVEAALKESLVASERARKELADQRFALDQHAIVAITDVQGTITYVNDKFCAISKYCKEELIGQNHRILNSGHHSKDFFQQMYHSIANGKVWHGEIRNRAKDGSIYWVDTTVVPFMGGDGKPRQYVAIRADITERKRAEEVREWLAAVVESSDDAIISKTLEGTITSWNRGAEKLFGYPSAEMLGKSIRKLLPPERMHEESDILAQIRRGASVDHFETVRVRKDGTSIIVSATISPIRDSSGAIVGASKIARDITERKRAEDAVKESLAASKATLKELADQKFALDQHAIVAITDVQGTITYVNDKFCAISKYCKEELIGQNHRILNSGHHSKDFFQQMYHSIANGKVWHGEIRNRAKDGSIYWVDTTVLPFMGGDGKPRQYVAIRADITERKRAEDAVKESLVASKATLKELADQKFALDQHAIVAITDVQGTITYVNDKFCAISKYSKNELIGQNHRILNSRHHPTKFFQEMYHTIARGQVWHAEICNRAKDGSIYWVDTTIVPFLSADGKPRQYVAIRADITQKKASEAEIQKLNDELESRVVLRTAQLEAVNKELEAFSYSVSHDLRAPLRHIGGFSKMLAEEFGATLDPGAKHYLDRIQHGTHKMGLLVDELLALARVGRYALNQQVTSLNPIVSEVISMLQPDSENRQVEWIVAELPPTECDPVLVKQIFQNLLANALKFTRSRAQAVIEVSCAQTDGQGVFKVRDNGVGFNIKYADKLFGVFQRLHRPEDFEGTGIGLATVQRIVQKHGGRVWAEAELDKGATFYFTLGSAAQTKSKTAIAGVQL